LAYFRYPGKAIVDHLGRLIQRQVMLYVLTYPDFEASVAEKIERFRQEYEPERARMVRPHLTLVFGLSDLGPTELIQLCEEVAKGLPPFNVEFSSTECVYDPFEQAFKLFALCGVGGNHVTALHLKLYEGSHGLEPDQEYPYRPHMTIATHRDRHVVESLDPTMIGSLPLRGTIDSLEIVDLVDGRLSSVRSVPLGA
jgi:2'-5' RNA ligase